MVELCRAARTELAQLGEVGAPLLSALDLVVIVAGRRGLGVLADPTFALEVLETREAGRVSPALVGRVPTTCAHGPASSPRPASG